MAEVNKNHIYNPQHVLCVNNRIICVCVCVCVYTGLVNSLCEGILKDPSQNSSLHSFWIVFMDRDLSITLEICLAEGSQYTFVTRKRQNDRLQNYIRN